MILAGFAFGCELGSSLWLAYWSDHAAEAVNATGNSSVWLQPTVAIGVYSGRAGHLNVWDLTVASS